MRFTVSTIAMFALAASVIGAAPSCGAGAQYSRSPTEGAAGDTSTPIGGAGGARPMGSGGHAGAGIAPGSGGNAGAGGRATSSGGAASGGSSNAGGAQASGAGGTNGGSASGGVSGASGGMTGSIGSGGKTASGGTGGAASGGNGGVSASGGTSASGGAGAKGSGGAASTGGVVGTGGRTSSSGGATSSGGNSGTAGQRILSIDFVGGGALGGAGGVANLPAMAPTETAGVKPAKNWNSAVGPMGSLTTLVLSDGTSATGATVAWNAPHTDGSAGIWRLEYPDAPGDVRMMNGCLNPGWQDAPSTAASVVTVSSLPSTLTSGGYDVYVYVLGGIPGSDTRKYGYTIGSTTFAVTQTGPTPAPTTPFSYVVAPNGGSGNYLLFKHVTASAFTVDVKPGSGSSVLRSPINGLQIVWPASP